MRDKTTLSVLGRITKRYLTRIILLCLLWFGYISPVAATTLTERLAQFPQWKDKPQVQLAQGDLEYPEWMAGTWDVHSTLIEQFAPLAPDIVTPGFADNQKYLGEPFTFQVRFGAEFAHTPTGLFAKFQSPSAAVVADRSFNGQQIAQTYLGADNVYRVTTDPENPNKQITLLRGERKLISQVTGRSREIPSTSEFLSTEITQQLFRSPERLYLNEVETTSDYRLIDNSQIAAEQITAIYLSPQDPDYFRAADRPVALYHYHLDLQKSSPS